jgi:hypothetical protein
LITQPVVIPGHPVLVPEVGRNHLVASSHIVLHPSYEVEPEVRGIETARPESTPFLEVLPQTQFFANKA